MTIIHSKKYSFRKKWELFIQKIIQLEKNYSKKYSFKKIENYSFKKIIHFFEKLIIAQGYFLLNQQEWCLPRTWKSHCSLLLSLWLAVAIHLPVMYYIMTMTTLVTYLVTSSATLFTPKSTCLAASCRNPCPCYVLYRTLASFSHSPMLLSQLYCVEFPFCTFDAADRVSFDSGEFGRSRSTVNAI